jgi:hypothetical protein
MSDKPFDKLSPLDQVVRRAARCGMTTGTVVVIEFFSGFELFNTRPYHNYETWSQGWRVHGRGAVAEREDLDDAISEWSRAVNDLAEGKEIEPHNRLELLKRDGKPYRAGDVIAKDENEG